MIISEIEYHMIILANGVSFNSGMKSDLNIIIPDIMLDFKGTVKKLTVKADRIHIHFTCAPDHSPKEIAENLTLDTSRRLARRHEKLKGYGNLFRKDCYFKSGKKPTGRQIDDFIEIIRKGI